MDWKAMPDPQETRQFWQNILKQEVGHNENAQWIKEKEEELKELIQMEWEELTVEELSYRCDYSSKLEFTRTRKSP